MLVIAAQPPWPQESRPCSPGAVGAPGGRLGHAGGVGRLCAVVAVSGGGEEEVLLGRVRPRVAELDSACRGGGGKRGAAQRQSWVGGRRGEGFCNSVWWGKEE